MKEEELIKVINLILNDLENIKADLDVLKREGNKIMIMHKKLIGSAVDTMKKVRTPIYYTSEYDVPKQKLEKAYKKVKKLPQEVAFELQREYNKKQKERKAIVEQLKDYPEIQKLFDKINVDRSNVKKKKKKYTNQKN